MSYTTHKGSSREHGFSILEEATRVNRAEHAARTPEQIAKAKDRKERRAARKAEALELETHFAAAVAGDPEKIAIAGISLSQKLTENHLPCSEKAWLERISDQTKTNIIRKDDNSVLIRGLPANLVLAKARIQDDILKMTTTPSPLPQ